MIKEFLALGLYLIMAIVIIIKWKRPFPWKNFKLYLIGGVVFHIIALAINGILMLSGKEPYFVKFFSIWTYIIILPLLIILSYLERPENGGNQVADTDKSLRD